MLRLRRGLGLPTGGPISCGEGVVRMERAGGTAEIDAWEFERLAGGADVDACAVVERYRGDVLSAEYAYDDTVEAYRQRLHRLFVWAATAALDVPPPDCDVTFVSSLAYRAWAACPTTRQSAPVAACWPAAPSRAGPRAHRPHGPRLIDLGLDRDALRVRTLQGRPAGLMTTSL